MSPERPWHHKKRSPLQGSTAFAGVLDLNRHMSDQSATSGLPAPDVFIVVPVRNEQDNVAPLIAEIAAALDGRWRYEIIYVNDGSTDATGERLAGK